MCEKCVYFSITMYHQFPQLAERVYSCRPHWQARMLSPVASSRPPDCDYLGKSGGRQGYVLAQRAHEVTQFKRDVPCIGGTDAT